MKSAEIYLRGRIGMLNNMKANLAKTIEEIDYLISELEDDIAELVKVDEK